MLNVKPTLCVHAQYMSMNVYCYFYFIYFIFIFCLYASFNLHAPLALQSAKYMHTS